MVSLKPIPKWYPLNQKGFNLSSYQNGVHVLLDQNQNGFWRRYTHLNQNGIVLKTHLTENVSFFSRLFLFSLFLFVCLSVCVGENINVSL